MSKILIISGGFFHLGFVIFHLFFWRLFQWEKDLASLIPINRAVMQILNLCLILVFLITAYISLFYSYELLSTSLGKVILVSVSIFWFIRTIEQLTFFGLKKLLSIILTILFITGTVIYTIPLIL